MVTNNSVLASPGQEILTQDSFRHIVLADYTLAVQSREASILGRKEVLTGKAKFGIFGDGKELAQIAMAKAFRKGDWRAGYYRDQTFAFATGMSSITQLFSQLYADTDLEAEPASGGRMMNCHFGTRFINADGSWTDQTQTMNSSSDISTTGGNMGRLLGLADASRKYRDNPNLAYLKNFSNNGNEVAFGTIGNASTSEGIFFESLNAAGVLQVPMAVSVWDDYYGISVPNDFQTIKQDISEALKGFQRSNGSNGLEIFKVRGWDYPALCEVYEKAIKICRSQHVPVLIHVHELTQPQGHSTSGSHERYKTSQRLQWEQEHDCNLKFRQWILENNLATEAELQEIEQSAKVYARDCQQLALKQHLSVLAAEKQALLGILSNINIDVPEYRSAVQALEANKETGRKDFIHAVRYIFRHCTAYKQQLQPLSQWYAQASENYKQYYNSKLFTNSADSPLNKSAVPAEYSADSKKVDGREVLNACFKANFQRDERIYAFGEDVGQIGDVNQGFAGLQQIFGADRISDTGIREMTIIGQGIGLAMRGLKPIAEIQYLDYLLFGINVLSDDLATLSYRTAGGQKAPVIIRTRGHRLEGIWHSGSPIGMILTTTNGVHLCVPRNMVQAAGMYNVLLRSDEPALVIESLNGYRLKEAMPDNVGEFMVPLGHAEILREGTDVTVVSYGSTLRIVQECAAELEKLNISIEIIDLQTLMPFDLNQTCARSVAKTNKLVIVDEDIPGGASAYILHKITEDQNAFYSLDAKPVTITAKAHRPPYGSDGDYFTKPSVDDVVDGIYNLLSNINPNLYPPMV